MRRKVKKKKMGEIIKGIKSSKDRTKKMAIEKEIKDIETGGMRETNGLPVLPFCFLFAVYISLSFE